MIKCLFIIIIIIIKNQTNGGHWYIWSVCWPDNKNERLIHLPTWSLLRVVESASLWRPRKMSTPSTKSVSIFSSSRTRSSSKYMTLTTAMWCIHWVAGRSAHTWSLLYNGNDNRNGRWSVHKLQWQILIPATWTSFPRRPRRNSIWPPEWHSVDCIPLPRILTSQHCYY